MSELCESCRDYMACNGCPIPFARMAGACGTLGEQTAPQRQPKHQPTDDPFIWVEHLLPPGLWAAVALVAICAAGGLLAGAHLPR